MQFSNDERHAETLALLAEVRDYIASWPPHPMNRDLIAKINGHIDAPLNGLVRRSLTARSAVSYTPFGLEIIRATLEGDKLTVTAPAQGRGISDEDLLVALRIGRTLTLKPDV